MPQQVTSKSLAGPSEICMLMPIKQGFTEGLASRTYESRLASFAKLFADLRAVARESRHMRPFSDIVDRLETIHGVTISIVDGQLLLAVHFDRPWEPYIRVIWQDLGDIFDLILCNCEGYAEHHRRVLGYEAFADWIHEYQVETRTFYMNSGHTVDDVIYLDQLERKVRAAAPGAPAPDLRRFQGPEEQAAAVRGSLSGARYVDYIKMGVQAIAAFHALTFLYPKGTRDHAYLLRAARSVLPQTEFPHQAHWKLTRENGKALKTLQAVFQTELDWFENYQEPDEPLQPAPDQPFDPGNIQGGIAQSYDANVGCLALVQITDAVSARRDLATFRQQMAFGTEQPADEFYRNIGFTAEGLRRLGLADEEYDKLPPAFRQGMAARAGLIGDLRHNHPDQWSMPERNWPPAAKSAGKSRTRRADTTQTVNVESVDLVIQLRRLAPASSDRQALDSRLVDELLKIEAGWSGGLSVLSVQPMYSLGEPGQAVEHFGFRDGLSNPEIEQTDPGATDAVPTGDIFLGHPNSHGDRLAPHWSEPLFKEGTFQVIRKLSQDVGLLNSTVDQNIAGGSKLSKAALRDKRDELLAGMMGRTKSGVPLVPEPGPVGENDFDFDGDPDGVRCPLFAHIRRANPRDQKTLIPRFIRRGMSYGPAYREGEKNSVDRGLVFQAYNASLSEQFEIVQRWISGGNRSAAYSRMSDPLLGVPDGDEPRIYPMADASKLNLGSQPFVRLLWGLYLFVPSRAGLAVLAGPHPTSGRDWLREGIESIERLRALEAQDADAAFNAWKRLLEEKDALDEELHRGVWQAVREKYQGALRTPFGVLVGTAEMVEKVLTTPEDFSVVGYRERLARCVGENYLGMDPPAHDTKASRANDVFYGISKEDAFDSALPFAQSLLGGLGAVGGQATIPLHKYADLLLAEVSKFWFGVPDGTTLLEKLDGAPDDPDAAILAGGEALAGAQTSHCPFHVISSSRFVFQPHPSDPVDSTATQQGQDLRKAMDKFVAPYLKTPTRWPSPFLKTLYKSLEKAGLEEDFANVLLGALLGYMPTVQGNFLFTTRDWLREGDFWRVQNGYLSARRSGHTCREAALGEIEPWLERSMAKRPIPAMIHRRATRDLVLGDVAVTEGEMVVVGLVSAAAQRDYQDVSPTFGGNYYAEPKPTHACPGRKLGMGTLLAMIAALFELPGTLRRAPSSSALLFDPPG